jgi:hypothetical protein
LLAQKSTPITTESPPDFLADTHQGFCNTESHNKEPTGNCRRAVLEPTGNHPELPEIKENLPIVTTLQKLSTTQVSTETPTENLEQHSAAHSQKSTEKFITTLV